MNHLHIDSVTKSYNGKVVLSDIFMSCKTGEITGLIGRNGSGKSTLLKIVFGIEKADTKFVKVDHKIIRTIADGRKLINYLPQDNFLPNGVSVKTIISLFLPKQSRDFLLKNPQVKPLLDKSNRQLSSGERRIIEILLIVHSKARFILLDEPFNGLSPIAREYVIEYIKTISTDKGFIITDHDYENVLNLANNIVYLKNGYLKPIENHNELISQGYLTTRMK